MKKLKKKKKKYMDSCLCVRACVIDEDITWRIKADLRL